jgi:hypothetical protein
MSAREFLKAHMAVIDRVYLDHEAGARDGLLYCRCGYRSGEDDWLNHVADKIADALEGESVVELPLEVAG